MSGVELVRYTIKEAQTPHKRNIIGSGHAYGFSRRLYS